MRFVTLVNRSSKTLEGVWNGRHYELAPGRHQFPEAQAEKFKSQHPIKGSGDPVTLHIDYLFGIEEHGDDCSPAEQSDAIELWNRSKLTKSRPVEVVAGDNGIYSVRDVAQTVVSVNPGVVATSFSND